MMRSAILVTATAALCCGQLVSCAVADKNETRLFEMRTYYANEGLLDHLHARFREHTNRLFVKHGMQLVGYWTPVGSEDTLVYVLAYPSREAREASWRAFFEDPEWKRVFEESHRTAGGPIVKKVDNVFLTPTDYSSIR